MASMHGKSGKRKKTKRIGKAEVLTRDQYESLGLDTRIALIQQLIPIGLRIWGPNMGSLIRRYEYGVTH